MTDDELQRAANQLATAKALGARAPVAVRTRARKALVEKGWRVAGLPSADVLQLAATIAAIPPEDIAAAEGEGQSPPE